MISAIEPEKVIVASSVPSPVENDSPVVPAKVRVPCDTETVTVWLSPSVSAIEIRFELAELKVRSVSSLVLWAEGTVITGSSLTAVISIFTLASLVA